MKGKNRLLLAGLCALALLSSCDEDDPEISNMATYPVSGDWTVSYQVETSPGVFSPISGATQLLIYNTAANDGQQVWVDDHATFWTYKVRAEANMSDLSFSADRAVSAATVLNAAREPVPYDIEVTISNGKVIRNGTRFNGQPADSIYFQVSFEDDDPSFGTVYHAFGHRTTGHE